jgi:hypothetical protein
MLVEGERTLIWQLCCKYLSYNNGDSVKTTFSWEALVECFIEIGENRR